MRAVGFILAVVVLMVGIGSNLAAVIDPPAIIIVLGFVLGALILSGQSIPLMLKAIRPAGMAPADLADAARAWKLARFYSLAGGMVGTGIGWIIMLKNLDDPAAIGPGLAISLLTVLYGMMLAFMVCLPLQTHTTRDLPDAADGSVAGTAVMATLLTVSVSLATVGVLVGTLG